MSDKPLHWSGSEQLDILVDEIASAGGYEQWLALQRDDDWDGVAPVTMREAAE